MRLFLGEVTRETEVRYSYVTVFIEQNICRLKITQRNITKCQADFQRNFSPEYSPILCFVFFVSGHLLVQTFN